MPPTAVATGAVTVVTTATGAVIGAFTVGATVGLTAQNIGRRIVEWAAAKSGPAAVDDDVESDGQDVTARSGDVDAE